MKEVEQLAMEVNIESSMKMIESFDKWIENYINQKNIIPPICWEMLLARYLCKKYNRYANDQAEIRYKPKIRSDINAKN